MAGGTARRTTPFQLKHALMFGLKVTRRAEDKTVVSVQCQFCARYGREEASEPGRRRKRTTNIKEWQPPFRKESYERHMKTQHPEAWEIYRNLSDEEKCAYFAPTQTSIAPFVRVDGESIEFQVRQTIVENIIADLYFRPSEEEDEDGLPVMASTKANALRLFRQQADGSYVVTIKHRTRFRMAMDYIAIGISFRQTARAIDISARYTKTALLKGINRSIVSQYARVLVGVSLNVIATLLEKAWAFSIAMDMSSDKGTAFMAIRLRICHEGTLYNFHLVAVPVFTRKTAPMQFDLIDKIMVNICPVWRDKLIAASSDGENTMTGRHSGLVTLLERAATHPVSADVLIRSCVYSPTSLK